MCSELKEGQLPKTCGKIPKTFQWDLDYPQPQLQKQNTGLMMF